MRARPPTAPLQIGGAREARAWIDALELEPGSKRWYIEVCLDTRPTAASSVYSSATDSRFHLNVYPEEWGVFFCHAKRSSWVRVTDEPFVHGSDEYKLLAELPPLAKIGQLLAAIEDNHGIEFQRKHAFIRTNVTGAKPAIREWLSTL